MGSIDFLNPDIIHLDENGEAIDWSEYYSEEEMRAFAHMSDDEIAEYDEAGGSYATLKAYLARDDIPDILRPIIENDLKVFV